MKERPPADRRGFHSIIASAFGHPSLPMPSGQVVNVYAAIAAWRRNVGRAKALGWLGMLPIV